MAAITIRPYTDADFDLVITWWAHHNEPGPAPGMMNKHCTFMLDMAGVPVMTLTALYTPTTIAYLEGFCASPLIDKETRNDCSLAIWDHAIKFLKGLHTTRIVVLTDKLPLVERYQELGMELQRGGFFILGKDL